MPENEPTNNDIEQINGNTEPMRDGDEPTGNDDPQDGGNDPQDGGDDTSSEELGKEKISILKPNFAKYLKLTRDGYTLADIIKIFGIDNEIDYGFPLKGEKDFVYTEQDSSEDALSNCYDSGEGSPLNYDNRHKFFEECDCKAQNNQVIFSDEAKENHSVINCEGEEDIKDGVTFEHFMIAKEAKFFPNKKIDNEKVAQFLDNYYELNNDDWKLNPEDATELENGGHQFYFNKDKDEITIPTDLEKYKEWAKIIDDIDEMDNDNYAQYLVARMKKIFDEPVEDFAYGDDEKLINFYEVLNAMFIDFFDQNEDEIKEALGAFRYHNAVAYGEVNSEDDLVIENYEDLNNAVQAINEVLIKLNNNGQFEDADRTTLKDNLDVLEEKLWYFIEHIAFAKVEAMRRLNENTEFDTGTDDTVRKMILEYARADGLEGDDLSFNRFLKIGFGKFLTEKAGGSDEDLIDFAAYYQYKDSMLRKLAMSTIGATEPGQDFNEQTPEHYQIAGFDKIPVDEDYVVDEKGLWIPEYKVTNIDEESGKIPTTDKEVEDLTPNWIDPANVSINEDGKEVLSETLINPEWTPEIGLDEVNLEKVDGVAVNVVTNQIVSEDSEGTNPNEPDPSINDGSAIGSGQGATNGPTPGSGPTIPFGNTGTTSTTDDGSNPDGRGITTETENNVTSVDYKNGVKIVYHLNDSGTIRRVNGDRPVITWPENYMIDNNVIDVNNATVNIEPNSTFLTVSHQLSDFTIIERYDLNGEYNYTLINN